MVFLSPCASSLVSVVLLASVFLVPTFLFFFFFPPVFAVLELSILRITIEPELVSHVNNTRLHHSYRRTLLRWLLRSPAPS